MYANLQKRFLTTTNTMGKKALTLKTINPNLKDMEYAVRGLVPMTAEKIQKELNSGSSNYPFKEILWCNIGNPQQVNQPPITFYRQVASLCDHPSLLSTLESDPSLLAKLPYDAHTVKRAREITDALGAGTGAYSNSQGVQKFREDVCAFINARDGSRSAVPENIFLTNGASVGIQYLLTALLSSSSDGVMIPVPQYPIYSALTKLLGGEMVGYYLDEQNSWALNPDELERSLQESRSKNIDVKALVVINPGNPTGSVLSYENLKDVVQFCEKHSLVLLADEVYQENIYNEKRPFISCRKVVEELGSSVELASFHSTSKGFIGECGKRGGYMELLNFDEDAKAQLVKLASSGLCSNIIGQVYCDLMVNGPQSNETFEKERAEILDGLKRKATMVYEKLNDIEGVECQSVDGAMYAFPRVELSDKFVQRAKEKGRHPDVEYALSLLEHTGLCAVPGSGFNQRPGTYHVRLTFLPEEDKLEKALDDFAKHHRMVNE